MTLLPDKLSVTARNQPVMGTDLISEEIKTYRFLSKNFKNLTSRGQKFLALKSRKKGMKKIIIMKHTEM